MQGDKSLISRGNGICVNLDHLSDRIGEIAKSTKIGRFGRRLLPKCQALQLSWRATALKLHIFSPILSFRPILGFFSLGFKAFLRFRTLFLDILIKF